MIRAYKSYWKNYFNFKERTSRKDFWLVVLMSIIIGFVLGLIVGIIMTAAGKEIVQLNPDGSNLAEYLKSPAMIVIMIWGLINLIPSLAIDVRRLHDINLSGWFILLGLIPYVGSLILLVLYLLPTKKEGERFGLYA